MKRRINICIVTILLIFESCAAQQKNLDINVFYEAQTRGSFIQYELTNNIFTINKNSENKSIILNDAEIKEFKIAIQKINLLEIKNIKAPSDKRLIDVALSANFKFIKNNMLFTSSEFDHENPPKEFYELYFLFKKLSNKKG